MPSNLNTAPAAAPASVGTDKDAEFEEILYHITHDVRASLRAIKTLPDWILEDLAKSFGPVPPSVQGDFEMLKTQTERADRILLDLRRFSRVGRRSDTPSQVDLRLAFSDAVAEVAPPDGFEIETDFRVREMRAPRNDIVTFFAALISNAVKHHTDAQGRIFASSRADFDGVHLSVEDDGPGIQPEFHDRVFKLMTTLRSRDECEGSGVGLAIIRKIVSNQGGVVGVSAPAHLGGTCVCATFPSARHLQTAAG